MNRRTFLESVSAGMAGSLAAGSPAASARVSPADKVSVAMMGVNGRGKGLTSMFASLPDVEIPYICDVDRNIVGPAVKAVQDARGKAPTVVDDIRFDAAKETILKDPEASKLLTREYRDHWSSLPLRQA